MGWRVSWHCMIRQEEASAIAVLSCWAASASMCRPWRASQRGGRAVDLQRPHGGPDCAVGGRCGGGAVCAVRAGHGPELGWGKVGGVDVWMVVMWDTPVQ